MKKHFSKSDKAINVRFYTDYNVCNYSCLYCIAGQHDKESITTKWDPTNYMPIIRKLISLPYKLNVRLGVGGEFFLNKELIEGARLLSVSENVQSINLITNLSFSPEKYEQMLDGFVTRKTALVASYHPSEIKNKEEWIRSAKYMNDKYDFAVVLIAYPPFLKELPKIKLELNEYGIEVFAQGFIGDYNNRQYPDSYSKEDKKILKEVAYSRHDYEFFVNKKKPGLCNAGYGSFYIDMTGVVKPCGMGNLLPPIGNLLKDTEIQFYDGPRPCVYNSCLCDTENMNTVIFEKHYQHKGINQHKYIFKNNGLLNKDEWKIKY